MFATIRKARETLQGLTASPAFIKQQELWEVTSPPPLLFPPPFLSLRSLHRK